MTDPTAFMPEAWNVIDYSNRTDFPQRTSHSKIKSATDLNDISF